MKGFESVDLYSKQVQSGSIMKGFEPIDLYAPLPTEREPIENVPPEPQSFMGEVVGKTALDVGKQAFGGVEAALSFGSGAAVWPAQKAAGLVKGFEAEARTPEEIQSMISDPVQIPGDVSDLHALKLKFDPEKARQAEEALNQFVYQPYTPEGQAAAEKIMQGLDIALKPSRMAAQELERMGFPLTAYLAEIGADLATFKMMHSAGKLPKQLGEARALKKLSEGPAPELETNVAELKAAAAEIGKPKTIPADLTDAVDIMRSEVSQGSVEKMEGRSVSTYPEWFRGRGWGKKEWSGMMDAVDSGKPLGMRQAEMYQETMDAAKEVKRTHPDLVIEEPPMEGFKPAELSETAIPEGRNIADTLKDLNDFFGEKGAIVPEGMDLTPGQKAALSRLRGDLETYKAKAKQAGKKLDQWLIENGVEPETASLLMREAEEMGKYAGSVNIKRQEISEDLKQVEHDLMADRPKKTQTWDETDALSDELIQDVKSVTKTIKGVQKRKAYISAEEADAMRKVNVNAIHALKKTIETGTPEEANTALKNYQDNILNITSEASSEAGRILNIHKKEISLTRMGSALGNLKKGLNERQYQELLQLDLTDAAAVKEFTRRLPDPKMSDYFLEYWYNSILSGPPTHLVNVLSNTAWQAWQVPHAALTAMVDIPYAKLTGKARIRYMNEILPMLAGYKKGFKPGAKAAAQTMLNKRVSEFETKWNIEMESSKDAFSRSPNKVLRKLSPYINPPTRALRAMDIWANQMAYDATLNRIVRRESNTKGLKGAERKAYETKRAQDIIKDGGELHEQAMAQARYNTFTDMPDPLTAHIIKARTVPVAGPALRFTVLPFVNTISNLLKRGVEMTPGLGIIKEAVSRGMERGSPTPEVIAKQIEGAIIGYYVLQKAADGEITGEMPKTAKEREAWYRLGKKPWSVKVGDAWIQYRRMEPYNTPIAMATNVYEKIKNAPDDQSATEAFTNFALSLKENVIEGSYLEGMQSLFDKYGKKKSAIPRFAASWMPYSSFFRSMNRAYEVATEGEATVKEGGEWLKAFSSVIPGLSSTMPKKLDVYGEPAVIPGGVLRQWLPFKWDIATDDPLENELDRLGFYPTIPQQKFKERGKVIDLPIETYQSYAIDYGQGLKKILTKAIGTGTYKKIPDDKKIKMLDSRMDYAKGKAKYNLRKQLRKGPK